jgi:hypothetical protein
LKPENLSPEEEERLRKHKEARAERRRMSVLRPGINGIKVKEGKPRLEHSTDATGDAHAAPSGSNTQAAPSNGDTQAAPSQSSAPGEV